MTNTKLDIHKIFNLGMSDRQWYKSIDGLCAIIEDKLKMMAMYFCINT